MLGLSRSTWHYRAKPRPRASAPVAQKDRDYGSRIDAPDRSWIEDRIRAGWKQGLSVDHSFATAWDEGIMLASRRSWWRIAAEMADQHARPRQPTGQSTSRTREKPVVVATGPGQVWSWDIERHEALLNLAVVKGHRSAPVAAGV